MKISNYQNFINEYASFDGYLPRNPRQANKIKNADKEELEFIFQDLKDDFPEFKFKTWVDENFISIDSDEIEIPILKSLLYSRRPGDPMWKDLSWIQRGVRKSAIGKFAQSIKTKKVISDFKNKLTPYFDEIKDRLEDIGFSSKMMVDHFDRHLAFGDTRPIDIIRIKIKIW